MDLRHATAFEDTLTCNEAPVSGDLGIPGALLIDPGSPSTSLVVNRASRRDAHGMPPLASFIADIDGVQMLANQVTVLAGCP
jgi:hypothetical protein